MAATSWMSMDALRWIWDLARSLQESREVRAMQCLVVEDDAVLAAALKRSLSDWGAIVSVADSLQTGLARLEQGPDLVVFDVRLPDGSGV